MTARHPPVDLYRSAQRALCLCQDENEGMGGEVPTVARPGQPPTEFACTHFLPATGSSVRAIQPFAELAPLILLPSPGAIGGTGLQGPSSLDC